MARRPIRNLIEENILLRVCTNEGSAVDPSNKEGSTIGNAAVVISGVTRLHI